MTKPIKPLQEDRNRTLHLRFRVKATDQPQLLEFLREALPFYEAPGGIRIRLLRSCDDPSRLIEVVEYRDREIHDRDQMRVDTDPQMRSLLDRWRALLQGPPEIETYEEITDLLREKGDIQ